jgi:hypothetical protein
MMEMKMNGKDKSPFDHTGGHPSDGYIDDPDVVEIGPQPDPADDSPSDGDIEEEDAPQARMPDQRP